MREPATDGARPWRGEKDRDRVKGSGDVCNAKPTGMDFGVRFAENRLMASIFERELATFRRELPCLLRDENNRGKYALIYGDRVDSIWDTVEQAVEAGYDRFGFEQFMVKEITEHEKPLYFSRNLS